MNVYTGELKDVEITGVEGFSYRTRERAGEVPLIFIRTAQGMEERLFELVSPGVVKPGGLKAITRVGVHNGVVTVKREKAV